MDDTNSLDTTKICDAEQNNIGTTTTTGGGTAETATKRSFRVTASTCKECFATPYDLYRDDSDGKLYCERCWRSFYRRMPPAKARFAGPLEEPYQPISDPSTTAVDPYYDEGSEERGEAVAPKIYVDRRECAWAAMLKSVESKTAFLVIQLIDDPTRGFVVYLRRGDLLQGPEASTLTRTEYAKLQDAKKAFEKLFFAETKNAWVEVKECYTKFITTGSYTLPVDVKAARRADNEARTRAKEEQRAEAVKARNEVIVKTAMENLRKTTSTAAATNSTAAATNSTAAATNSTAAATNSTASATNSTAAAFDFGHHVEERLPDTRRPDAGTPSDNGIRSPPEPPCSPAVVPVQPTIREPSAAAPLNVRTEEHATSVNPPDSARKKPSPEPLAAASTNSKVLIAASAAAVAVVVLAMLLRRR